MTITLERTVATTARGDEALAIIDHYRQTVGDRTHVDELEVEFPYYAHELGLRGVAIADLGDNLSGAFKWRGAMVGATTLQQQGAERMIAPSAGNHARGAVLAAKALDMALTVAVPSTAPHAKREGIRDLWGSSQLEVRVAGSSFDDSLRWAYQQPGALLHPYDNPVVIAGQGTAVDDILSLHPDTKHIVMPIGGGGLAAGVLGRLHELGRNDIQVHLAEATGSNSASRSLQHGEVTTADQPNTRYGGSAVQRIGAHAYRVLRRSQHAHLLQVPEHDVDELSSLYEDGRRELMRTDTPNYEPTTLVAVAALKQLRHLNEPVTVLGTGHNDSIYPHRSPARYHLPV